MSARKVVIEFLGDSSSLNRAMTDSSSKSSKFGNALKTAGKAAAVGLAAGAVVAGKALYDMTKAAVEDEAAQVKLATTLKNTAGATAGQVAAVEEWISAQGRALGVTDDELRPALQRMAEATGDVEKAQRLVSVAMDVAAGTGRSLKSVTEAMLRAQNGSVDGLGRYGIATKNAAGETLSFDQVVKGMSKTFGGQAAKAADTTAGKMARLKLTLAETGETIGAKLIPVVDKMASWFLNRGLPALSKFGGYLQEKLPPIFERVRAVFAKVTGALSGDSRKNLGAVLDIFKSVTSIIRSLWKRFGGYITTYAVATFKNLRTVIGGALKIIRGIFKVFASLLKGDWKGVWQGIKLIVSGAFSVIKGIVKQAFNVIKLAFRVGASAVKGIWSGLWTAAKALARNGLDWIVGAVKAIPGKIRGLAGAFRDAGRSLIGAMIDGLKNAAGVISGIAGNVWTAVKSMLNSAIDKINAALEFTISLPGPNLTINPANIPHLAKGTTFHRGGLALVGEEGPELVSMPRGSQVKTHRQTLALARGGSLGGGGVTVNINGPVYGDPRAFARFVVSELRKEKRLLGANLGLA